MPTSGEHRHGVDVESRDDSSSLNSRERGRSSEAQSLLTIVATVASQAALITAVLYYFGWTRTYAFFDYFGVDYNLAGYDTSAYVLRSIGVAFQPLTYAAFVGL